MAKQQDRREPSAESSASTDWVGVVTSADPHDLPAGASVDAMNVASTRKGELRARGGAAVLKFD
jgi:hypothetical protein